MGKTYKAVEITKPETFRLVEKPVVGPGEEQVRIRVEACGVCHSDAGTVEGSGFRRSICRGVHIPQLCRCRRECTIFRIDDPVLDLPLVFFLQVLARV